MERVRAEFDADKERENKPSETPTKENRFEAVCGMCGGAMFVDKVTHERVLKAIGEGMEDNPLVCPSCESDYQAEMFRT